MMMKKQTKMMKKMPKKQPMAMKDKMPMGLMSAQEHNKMMGKYMKKGRM